MAEITSSNVPDQGVLDQKTLDRLLPPERSDAFFDALYGDAEEGAYDIKLVVRNITADTAHLAFELHQRPNKCLVCSLTYGLPQVFQRHPLINTAGMVKEIGELLGWPQESLQWQLGRTEEKSHALHYIPLTITSR